MKSFAGILAAALVSAAVGVLLVVYSANDDAPGGALMGFLLIVGASVIAVRTVRRRRQGLGGRPGADGP